ncbi:MAG: CehA/McbA family metallohydrolase [Candidatus Methylacidiphilales bacterium]
MTSLRQPRPAGIRCFDTHTHSCFSVDGVSRPRSMVSSARAAGLDGLVLTDHDTCAGVDYLLRQGLMREDGLPVDDFLVIPGQEVSTREGHVLVLGLKLQPMPGVTCSELIPMVKAGGGLTIAAHPFDPARRGVGRAVLEREAFDGMEVFNSASWFPGLNRMALRYALSRTHPWILTAGSDAHHPAAIGRSYLELNMVDFSVAGFLEALMSGSFERKECLLRPIDYVRKSWFNMLRPGGIDALRKVSENSP